MPCIGVEVPESSAGREARRWAKEGAEINVSARRSLPIA
jgi:hypothetical protein